MLYPHNVNKHLQIIFCLFQAVLNAAGTLARISSNRVLPQLVGVITDSLQNPALYQVTREEYAIMQTPEGELYDKSIMQR